MLRFKKKTNISIELTDYILRALVKRGAQPTQWAIYEFPLAPGIVQDSVIIDEIALFQIFKNNLTKLGGKNQAVRMFVPDVSVMLKSFDYPENLQDNGIREYVQMELGRSIHLPFRDPLLDVYDPVPGDGQATLFAAPSEEIQKLIGLLLDVHLVPEAVDVRALCNLRLLQQLRLIDEEKTYMITNWSINEVSICIYSYGKIEFLRYQSIETDLKLWQPPTSLHHAGEFIYQGNEEEYIGLVVDRILELGRIANFFKFSLHKGEKEVDEMIMLGDNPLLGKIHELLTEQLPTPVVVVEDHMIMSKYPSFKVRHASLIGLALKEVAP